MTTHLSDLDEVVRLAGLATPSKWYADEPVQGFRRFIVADCGPVGKVYPSDQAESHGTKSIDDARAIAAAVNYIRQHHAAIRRDAEDARLFRAVMSRSEKVVGGEGVRFELRFDALDGQQSLRGYLGAAIAKENERG